MRFMDSALVRVRRRRLDLVAQDTAFFIVLGAMFLLFLAVALAGWWYVGVI
jgi:hypothetical protein